MLWRIRNQALAHVARKLRVFVRHLMVFTLMPVCACGSRSATSPSSGSPLTAYVSTTGSNGNDGTITAPWLTVGYAVSRLKAGDTLYIRGGTYTGSANTINDSLGTVPSGTSWANAITIAGYPGETVTLQPPGTDGIHLATSVHRYIIFQDVTVDGSLGTSDSISAIVFVENQTYIRFLRVEVKNAWKTGFDIFDGSFNEVLSSSVHDNGRSGVAGGPTAGGGGNYGYGFYVTAADTLLEGNDVYRNGGYGFQVANDRNTIRRNRIHDNGTYGGTNYGVELGLGYVPSTNGSVVSDNLIYGNRGGILVYTHSSNTAIYNNTIYNNGPAGAIDVQYIAGDVTIQNNTLYGNTVNAITNNGGFSGGSIRQGNNLFGTTVSPLPLHVRFATW